MREVRRSGFRPRLLPEPPAAEVPLDPGPARRSPPMPRSAVHLQVGRIIFQSRGYTGCHPPALAAARPRRRQVAGRIPERISAPTGPSICPSTCGQRVLPRRNKKPVAKILDVKGRQVWDTRGRPTVEAEVIVGRGTTPLAMGRAIAPAGASTGAGEAKTVEPRAAVHNIRTRIRDGLRALSVSDQAKVDERLIELDGTADRSRLGANAMVAASLACAQADAAAQKMPLWKKLSGEKRVALPVPQIQIFGGGAHARGRCDLQDYMIICIGAGSFAEAREWTSQV